MNTPNERGSCKATVLCLVSRNVIELCIHIRTLFQLQLTYTCTHAFTGLSNLNTNVIKTRTIMYLIYTYKNDTVKIR